MYSDLESNGYLRLGFKEVNGAGFYDVLYWVFIKNKYISVVLDYKD